MIESQEDALASPTVLAAAMLRVPGETSTTPEDEAMQGTKATSLTPKITSTTQGFYPPKKSKRSAMDIRRAKATAEAKAGNIPGNSSNHNSNAARGLRVAEESRGGVAPGNHPKILNEGVPPIYRANGGTQNARAPPILFPNITTARNK